MYKGTEVNNVEKRFPAINNTLTKNVRVYSVCFDTGTVFDWLDRRKVNTDWLFDW